MQKESAPLCTTAAPSPRHAMPKASVAFVTGVLTTLALVVSVASSGWARASLEQAAGIDGPLPAAEHSAADVVKIVVTALQQNDAAGGNQGIATVYRFASPGNRQVTGPYTRFLAMIHHGFPDMLNHLESRFDPIEVSGDIAVQTVWLLTRTGDERGYLFQLGRQQSGEYAGMWMTEAVVPVGNRAPRMVI